MAYHSKKDFAALCGITTSNLSEYVTRKKVILSGDFVDDTIQQNIVFLQRRIAKGKAKEVVQPTNNRPPVNNLYISDPNYAFSEPNTGTKSGKKSKPAGDDDDFIELERQKMTLEIQKKTEEIEILRMRSAKQAGLLVPIDHVKQLFTLFSQAILNCQKETLDRWLINIAAEARLSDSSLSNLRKYTTQALNEGANRSVDVALHDLIRLAEEHALKRDVGEHD